METLRLIEILLGELADRQSIVSEQVMLGNLDPAEYHYARGQFFQASLTVTRLKEFRSRLSEDLDD